MSPAEDMARRPQPGPHRPLAKPQPPRVSSARPAAGEGAREKEASERGARYAAQRPSGRGVGSAGGRGVGSGTRSTAPTPRPAALPPALTAREPTSGDRTAPNGEVLGANHRTPRRGVGETSHSAAGSPNSTHLQLHKGRHSITPKEI